MKESVWSDPVVAAHELEFSILLNSVDSRHGYGTNEEKLAALDRFVAKNKTSMIDVCLAPFVILAAVVFFGCGLALTPFGLELGQEGRECWREEIRRSLKYLRK